MSMKTENAEPLAEALAEAPPKAGKRLGLGRNASYEAVKRGDLPSIRIGGKILVPVRAIEALLDGAVEDWLRRRKAWRA